MHVLSDNLAHDAFSRGSGLAWVMERVDASIHDRSDVGCGLDVRVLVDEEEDVEQVDAGAQLVWIACSP